LVDHPDPELDGPLGRADDHVPALHADPPPVGLDHPGEDAHEGGLAGPVLAEQAVDLARAHHEVDAVVGQDARIGLRDAHKSGPGGPAAGGRVRTRLRALLRRDRGWTWPGTGRGAAAGPGLENY